jgi:hypothetical protein
MVPRVKLALLDQLALLEPKEPQDQLALLDRLVPRVKLALPDNEVQQALPEYKDR